MSSNLTPSNIDARDLHLIASDRSIRGWGQVLIDSHKRIQCLPDMLEISHHRREGEISLGAKVLLFRPTVFWLRWLLKTVHLQATEAVQAQVYRQQLLKDMRRILYPQGVDYLFREPWKPWHRSRGKKQHRNCRRHRSTWCRHVPLVPLLPVSVEHTAAHLLLWSTVNPLLDHRR